MGVSKFTVLAAWKLHLKCCEALAGDSPSRMRSALESVRSELGEELTRILSPLAEETLAEENLAEEEGT